MAQFFSYIFANLLMQRMNEIMAFDVLISIAFVTLSIFIAWPSGGIHIYVANIMLVIAACGLFSVWLIILEKRTPPTHSGRILILARTFSMAGTAMSPIIATLEAPLPHLITASLCLTAFFATHRLPPAGCYT